MTSAFWPGYAPTLLQAVLAVMDADPGARDMLDLEAVADALGELACGEDEETAQLAGLVFERLRADEEAF
jgi:hypothetical protein